MKREVTITKSTFDESSDHGYMAGTMAERIEFAWELSREVWSLLPGQDKVPPDAEPRLQRHVTVLRRREG